MTPDHFVSWLGTTQKDFQYKQKPACMLENRMQNGKGSHSFVVVSRLPIRQGCKILYFAKNKCSSSQPVMLFNLHARLVLYVRRHFLSWFEFFETSLDNIARTECWYLNIFYLESSLSHAAAIESKDKVYDFHWYPW